jgi:hypothetical protein
MEGRDPMDQDDAMTPPLTNLQREILEVFSMELSEAELRNVKRHLARYFAERATADFEEWADEEGIDANQLREWAHDHDRSSSDRSGHQHSSG